MTKKKLIDQIKQTEQYQKTETIVAMFWQYKLNIGVSVIVNPLHWLLKPFRGTDKSDNSKYIGARILFFQIDVAYKLRKDEPRIPIDIPE